MSNVKIHTFRFDWKCISQECLASIHTHTFTHIHVGKSIYSGIYFFSYLVFLSVRTTSIYWCSVQRTFNDFPGLNWHLNCCGENKSNNSTTSSSYLWPRSKIEIHHITTATKTFLRCIINDLLFSQFDFPVRSVDYSL